MHRLLIFFVLGTMFASSILRAEEPFDYFRNSWSLIGLKDYLDGTRISPDNDLLLADKQKLRISFGRHLTPLSRRQTKTLQDGWLPIVLLSANQGEIEYRFTMWAAPLPTIEDWKSAYEGPSAGENYLNWVRVVATNRGAKPAEARVRIERIGSTDQEPISVDWTLAAGEEQTRDWCFPFQEIADAHFEDVRAGLWYCRTQVFWRRLLKQGALVETPDARANDALRASHVYQFINNDHGVVQGGEGFYDVFYIRDGAYEVQQFEEAGFLDAARESMNAYLAAQRPDGRFESQKGQLDANGQAVWALWQFYKITADREWLEDVYPAMLRSVEWVIQARKQAPSDSPFAGVLPNALADGEYLWDGKHHIVGYDFWNLRGLLCTADAARTLGRNAEADRLENEANSYLAAINAAWKRTGLPHFPPSWEKVGTHWGNTETLWPTPLFAPDDPRVSALITEVRDNFGGGFHEGTIRWRPGTGRDAIHPYMSSYTTLASLELGEHERVVQDFYWYLLHSTAAHAFAEGIYYRRRVAWSDTIPHATGASNYALLLRHMLVHETKDELHLLAAVPDWWFEEGRTIRIERAPTHFGEVGLCVHGTEYGLEVSVNKPKRNPPRRVVLHLPQSRPCRTAPEGIHVVVRPEQSRRWDLPAVVEAYEQIKPQPIPGLISFPLDEPPDPGKCLFLELNAAANTDPFSAPFGVPRPGRLLFTDMPVGRQSVSSIPFQIMDPARNDGRGLLVLEGGPAGGPGSRFPREATLPVMSRGKRVFFLGSVVGWSRDDAGTGELNAVAEYIIEYADGERQTIPWILGRTTDDWAVTPMADQVHVGLRGDPWHLNVVAAPLRPAPVQRIVFRDLGTVSAPVLVAVTVEQ